MLICRQGNSHIGNRTDDAVATRCSHTWGKSYFLRNFVYISWFNWNVFSLCVELQLVDLVAFQRRDNSVPRKPPLYLPTTRDFLETCKCKLIYNNNRNSLKGSWYAFWFPISLFIHKWHQEKENLQIGWWFLLSFFTLDGFAWIHKYILYFRDSLLTIHTRFRDS